MIIDEVQAVPRILSHGSRFHAGDCCRREKPDDFYRFYYRTYVERDISAFVNLRNKSRFEKFMKLLVGRVGQLLNLSSLSAEVGISSTTLEEWLSLLEAAYVCYRLRPWFANVSNSLGDCSYWRKVIENWINAEFYYGL